MQISNNTISEDTKIRVEFFDVDSMDVAYHGNYVKYLEIARCNLLDKIGYGYNEMRATNFVFPVTTLNVKYVRSLKFEQEAVVTATLIEWENRMRIKYVIRDMDGNIVTKAETTQMAVKVPEMESLFVCPECFTSKVEALLMSCEAAER